MRKFEPVPEGEWGRVVAGMGGFHPRLLHKPGRDVQRGETQKPLTG